MLFCLLFFGGFSLFMILYPDALGESRDTLLLSVLAFSSLVVLWAATSDEKAFWLLPSLWGIGIGLKFLDFSGTFNSLTLEPIVALMAMFYYWGVTNSESDTAWSSYRVATRYVPVILLLGLQVGQLTAYTSSNPMLFVFIFGLAASLLMLFARTLQGVWTAWKESKS